MSNSVGQLQKQQAQDMAELNEEFRKKRRDVVNKSERSLKELREDYRDRIQEERESGAAAINHIKKDTRKSVNTTRESAANMVEHEQTVAAKKIKQAREEGTRSEEAIREKRVTQEQQYNKMLERARQEKVRQIAQEQKVTKEVQENESTRRSAIQKNASQEIADIMKNAAHEKGKVLGQNREQLQQMNEEHRKNMHKQHEEHATKLESQREESYSTLKKQNVESQAVYDRERLKYSNELKNLKDTTFQEYAKEKVEGEQRLTRTKTVNKKELDQEIARSSKHMETTRKEFADNIKKVHQDGEFQVKTQEDHFKKQIIAQDSEYKKKIEEKRLYHNAELKKGDELHAVDMQKREDAYRGMLTEQRKEFDTAFAKNETTNRQALHNQNDRLMDALIRQKSSLVERYGKYDNAKDDPFYKMQEFETHIDEHSDYYLVRTKVPEHEKQNVDVIVKDDQIIVSGQRAFAENIKKDKRQVATNSYQSFRETIPLKHPTVPKSIEKTYVDGAITVFVPKIPIR